MLRRNPNRTVKQPPTQSINILRRNPKRTQKQPVNFADEQVMLMGKNIDGKNNKYHGWKDTYDREFHGDNYIKNINQNHSTNASGYKLDNFVVENNDNVYYLEEESEYSEEESEDSDEEEFEDSEEEFEDSDEEE